jgi:hypothetical protein
VQCCWTSERVHMSVEAGPCASHAGGRFNSTSAYVGRTHPPAPTAVLLTSVHALSVMLPFQTETAPPAPLLPCKQHEQDHSEQRSLTSKVEDGAVLLDERARAHVR